MTVPTERGRILRATGRTQAWLARQLQMDPSSISRWVRGERPTPRHHLPRIAEALDVDEQTLRQQTLRQWTPPERRA